MVHYDPPPWDAVVACAVLMILLAAIIFAMVFLEIKLDGGCK